MVVECIDLLLIWLFEPREKWRATNEKNRKNIQSEKLGNSHDSCSEVKGSEKSDLSQNKLLDVKPRNPEPKT